MLMFVATAVLGQNFGNAVVGSEVSKASISYKLRLNKKSPNELHYGEMMNQTVEVTKSGDVTKGFYLDTVSVASGPLMSLETKLSKPFRGDNPTKDVLFLNGLHGGWVSYPKNKFVHGIKKSDQNVWAAKYDIESTVEGESTKKKNYKCEIHGYLTFDVKLGTFLQIDEMWVEWYDPIVNKTCKKQIKITGNRNKATVTILWDDPTAMFSSSFTIDCRKLAATDTTSTYALLYKGMNVPPGLLMAVAHYWGSYVLPLDE